MKAILIFIITFNAHALEINLFDNLFKAIKPGQIDNCDSEFIKEHQNYDYKNPPKNYFNKNHWLKQLEKAKTRKNYCRQAQIYYHLFNTMPYREYKRFKGHEKVIESLLAGHYFLELQWQVRNYREEYGVNERVEFMQVKSYWHYIDQLNRDQRCVAPKAYYTNPRTKKEFRLTTEAHLSANDFLKKFPESAYAQSVQKKKDDIKDAHVLSLICETKSVQSILDNRKESKNTAYNYFPMYKRLATVVANYKTNHRVDEAIYLLIGICHKLDEKTQHGILYPEHPDNFIFSEDWLSKASSLKSILWENFPSSPWTHKLSQ